MTDKPRAYTRPEMQRMLLDHLRSLVAYWARTDLARPEFAAELARKGDALYRLEGLLFSFLVVLDGGSGDMPAFDLIPSPHPSDRRFHRDQGENWWPSGVVINECQLHELLYATAKEQS